MSQRKEVVVDKKLSKQLQLRTGEETIGNLTACLLELKDKPPVFAMAAMSDCILAMEALIKQHCTTDPDTLQIICGSFGVALGNAATMCRAAVIHCDDDEVIYDYNVEEIDMDAD